MHVKTILREGVDWIDLGQEKEKWRAVLKAAMTLGYHKMWGIS
jgi:hypothetical protein